MGFQGASPPTVVNVDPAPVNVAIPANAATTNLYGARVFGNGSDGSVTIAGTVTLTRDMQYANLTVQAGGVLNTAGFRVRVAGVLTNAGTIHCNAPGGTAGAPTGSFGGGGAGGTFASPPGNPGSPPPHAGEAGWVSGGDGGKASGSSGALGGDAQQPATLSLADTANMSTRSYTGGAGGGGANVSPGGGGGGGVLGVLAATIINTGALQARGADGAAQSGGGGGGVAVLVYRSFTGNAPDVSGGAAFNGASAGIAGSVAEVILP